MGRRLGRYIVVVVGEGCTAQGLGVDECMLWVAVMKRVHIARQSDVGIWGMHRCSDGYVLIRGIDFGQSSEVALGHSFVV